MLTDARSLRADSVLHADVCVIGGGAAGIILALELQRSGLRTLVLESGGLEGPDPATQDLHRGESVGQPIRSLLEELPLDAVRLRWLGGTTNHWAGFCRKLEPIDFEPRDHLSVSGWPLESDDLEPYWQRASGWCRITDASDDPHEWSRRIGLAPPLTATRAVHTRAFQITPFMRFGEEFRSDLEGAEDTEVLLWANVVNLATTDGRRVEAAQVRTLSGNRLEVAASAYVLAVGGLENPRLLLASADADPSGLGNGHDQVGRYFCEHLQTAAGFGVLDASLEELEGYMGGEATIASGRFAGHSHGVKYTLALTSDHVREVRTLGLEAQMLVDSLPSGVPYQSRGLSPSDVSDLVALTSRRTPTSVAYLQALAEQRLRADSRVTLAGARDALGMRRLRLDWRYGVSDRVALLAGLRTMADAVGAVGLGRLQVIPGGVTVELPDFFEPERFINLFGVDLDSVDERRFPVGVGHHHMCTTRMSADPATGVVDSDCRVHGMGNLWIAGSSVFATGGVATPTFTVVALAVRLADHLRSVLL